jgi:hypothetical protein
MPASTKKKSKNGQRTKAANKTKVREISPGTKIIEDLTSTDVLLGRGNGVAGFVGNQNFRKLVWSQKDAYASAYRNEKGVVAVRVMRLVAQQDPPGRFVERIGPNHFFEVDESKALEKTCQALREKKNKRPPGLMMTQRPHVVKPKELRAASCPQTEGKVSTNSKRTKRSTVRKSGSNKIAGKETKAKLVKRKTTGAKVKLSPRIQIKGISKISAPLPPPQRKYPAKSPRKTPYKPNETTASISEGSTGKQMEIQSPTERTSHQGTCTNTNHNVVATMRTTYEGTPGACYKPQDANSDNVMSEQECIAYTSPIANTLKRGSTKDMDYEFAALPPHLTAFFSGIYSNHSCFGDDGTQSKAIAITPIYEAPPTTTLPATWSHPSNELASFTSFLWGNVGEYTTSTSAQKSSSESPPTVVDFDLLTPPSFGEPQQSLLLDDINDGTSFCDEHFPSLSEEDFAMFMV